MTKKTKGHKKQKMSNPPPSPSRLSSSSSSALSSLPNEVLVSILARISKSHYSSLCLVSKRFYSLLSSPEIYTARSEIRAEKIPRLYLNLSLPKPEKNSLFTLFDKVGGKLGLALRLSSSYESTRLNSTSVAVGSEIYQIGGSKLSRAVRVLDCRSHTWRLAPRLTVPRKDTKSCYLDGKIYVIGGREDESMIWGEVFDIKTQIWKSLPCPDDDNSIDSDPQVVVVLEGRVNVISKQHKYVYDTEQERWLRDVLFKGIEVKNGLCCVIDNVMFAEIDGKYKWYNSSYKKWLEVKNLEIVSVNRARDHPYRYKTVQLVNHGGKLVILWNQRETGNYSSSIWCAVIKLEKCLTHLETQFWGELERYSYLRTFPESFKLLSCLSIYL